MTKIIDHYRKFVDQTPAELLCNKSVDARNLHDLGQLGRVTKSVREPELQHTTHTEMKTERERLLFLNITHKTFHR